MTDRGCLVSVAMSTANFNDRADTSRIVLQGDAANGEPEALGRVPLASGVFGVSAVAWNAGAVASLVTGSLVLGQRRPAWA